ncbi:MAG: lactate racemase domain-containing protein, partial [Anaerolineae bacterium]
MLVELDYGQGRTPVTVPDNTVVLRPKPVPGVGDEAEAIRQALRNPVGCKPLREQIKATDRIVILFSDITRPMPSDRVLPVLLAELSHIDRDHITLMNAVGTHRANTQAELEWMLGPEIVRDYRIMQHNAWDKDNLVHLGTSSQGHPQYVNRYYHEADFRIATG